MTGREDHNLVSLADLQYHLSDNSYWLTNTDRQEITCVSNKVIICSF